MSVETIPVSLPTLSLTNSATNYLWDSTAPIGVAPAASYTNYGHGITAQASLSVGPRRKQYPNLSKLLLQVLCATQDVTVFFASLIGTSWTVINGTGAGQVVTAGTTTFLDYVYDVNGNESRLYITNGGTGPSALAANLKLVMDDRGGA